jgi:hypothetical protein
MARVEVRSHLGPHEVELGTDLYGVMLVGSGNPILSNTVYGSKEAALIGAAKYDEFGYVVTIKGTNA